MPEVDFYLINNQVSAASFKLASRLANKLQRLGQRALVVTDNAQEAAALDQVMWVFSDTSFVSHERLHSQPQGSVAPAVVIAASTELAEWQRSVDNDEVRFDVLINLSTSVPPITGLFGRVAEIVGPEEAAKGAARQRYREYQSSGCTLRTHKMEI